MTIPKPTTPAITRAQEAIVTVKYDLKAMAYEPSVKAPFGAYFRFGKTPQGQNFWDDQRYHYLTEEGLSALAEMAKQYAAKNAANPEQEDGE